MVEQHNMLNGTLNAIPTVMIFFVMLHYLPKVWSDMFTGKRSAVAHRRFLPEKNNAYKAVVFSTTACVVIFFISRVCAVIRYYICPDAWFQILVSYSYQFGKMFMYMIFLVRLHMVFSGSLYQYSVGSLKRWAIFFVIYSLVVIVVFTFLSLSYDKSCGRVDSPLVGVAAGLVLIEDVIFSIGFVVSFMKPLRKLLHLVEMTTERRNEAERREADKNSGKFYYIAVKITILTSVAVTSTIICLLILVVFNIDMLGVDVLINILCVVFMMPYYQDGRYYQKVCFCCVKCCTPRGKRYMSKVRPNDTTDRGRINETLNVSVDTADQVRHATRNLAPDTAQKTQLEVVKSAESEIDVTPKTEIVYDNVDKK